MQNILLIHPLSSSSSSPPLSSSSSSKEPTFVRFYIAVFCSSSYCSCCFCTSFSFFILSHNVCQNVSHTHTYYILHCIAYQHVQQPKCYIRPYKQTERHSLNHTHTLFRFRQQQQHMQCAVTERTDDENRKKATVLRVSESVKVHRV